MAPKPKVTRAEILEWMNRNPGQKPADAARALGTSRQVISYHLKNGSTNGWESPAARATAKLPWDDVPHEIVLENSGPYRRCRDHLLYMDTGGEGMNREMLGRLRRWYEQLTEWNEVLEYDPNIPPSRDVRYGHFAYRTRTKRDKDLILRRNEYTKLTKSEIPLWRIPERSLWPDVD